MAPAIIETDATTGTTLRDRAIEAGRHAAHLSHEARMLKSVAQDAVEEGLHQARRAVRRRIRDAEDLRDEAVRRVRQQPLAIVGAALGVGLVAGLLAGLVLRRPGRRA